MAKAGFRGAIHGLRTLFSRLIVAYLRVRGADVHPTVRFVGWPTLRLFDYSCLSIGAETTIDARVVLWQSETSRIDIGCRSYLGIGAVLNSTGVGGQISIGDETLIGAYCLIQDNNHGMDPDIAIRDQPLTVSPIRIGDDCWLGAQTSVLAGAVIGDGAVIGANSVVHKRIGPGEVWAGSPARLVRRRIPSPSLN